MSPSCREVDAIKSPSSTTSWISNSSSPSSTLSDSSNSPFAISTRKPRTPRKRPNQTYNEAAAILSTAYPKIFPTKPSKFDSNCSSTFLFEPSELLMPFPFQELDNSEFLFDKPHFPIEIKAVNENPCGSPADIEFDAESILDEEMGEGIESIMGNLEMENEPIDNSFCIGYPVGMGMEVAYGMRRESRTMRNGDWWSNGNTSVNVIDLSKVCSASKKRKKEEEIESVSVPQLNGGTLLLKLNYDGISDAWSDKDSPFPGDSPASESAGNDVRARLAQIDLFWDNGGVREASVQRYKEKRRNRLFSKKIRYEVRKVNADRRPRMKGRFVRKPDLEMQWETIL